MEIHRTLAPSKYLLTAAVVNEITAELVKLEDAQNRLCYYVSRLESRQAAVLQLAFFDGLSWYQGIPFS